MDTRLFSIRLFVGLALTTAACMPPVTATSTPEQGDAPAATDTPKSDAPAAEGGSCEKGNAADCTAKGDALASSDKDADLAKARALYQKACDGKDGDGCAKLYDFAKRDTPRDEKKLAAIAVTGCEAKNAQCCALAADRYEEGKGLEKDHAKAVAARAVSCESSFWGDCKTINTLAKKPGEKAAKEVFDRWTASCKKGDAKACDILKK